MIICLAIAFVALAGFIVAEKRVAHPMFDLSLLRTPTFAGGSIAAFAMNGSLYTVLLYLVIYLQDILGYSAQDAGLRLAIISGAQFVTATIAGRVSERVPARWLIGPGLLLVSIGLVVMASGVSATFRQIGIATGIAALGSVFTAAMQHNLAHAPSVAASAPRIVTLVRQGEISRLFASTPPAGA